MCRPTDYPPYFEAEAAHLFAGPNAWGLCTECAHMLEECTAHQEGTIESMLQEHERDLTEQAHEQALRDAGVEL